MMDGKLLDHNPYEDDETAGDETDAADETEEETGGRDRRGNFRCGKGDDAAVKETCEGDHKGKSAARHRQQP